MLFIVQIRISVIILIQKKFNASVSFRIDVPKNNQQKGVHMINDYLNVPKMFN